MEKTEAKGKKNRQYFTRKNFIAFSLVALYSILLVFVAVCIDRSELGMVSAKNPLIGLADSLKMRPVATGIYGIVCVTLVAVYAVIFTVAFVFERRLAYVNGKPLWSKKMLAIYGVTFCICLVLSVGLGLLIQPKITGENILDHLTFLGECLLIAAICYLGIGAVIAAVAMFIVNFRKVNKPFDFFGDKTLDEVMEEEPQPSLAESFDAPQETAPVSTDLGHGMPASGLESAIGGAVSGGSGALEDRETVFPALSSVDKKYEGYPAEPLDSADVDLRTLCNGFRNYLAKHEKLYYDIETVRMFVCGLAAARIILLEGLSGTGKSSLPRYFAKYVNGRATFLAVQATWRDRTNLLGYFNEFSKTYAETDFLSALYEASYDEDRIHLFILDELNISRVEYYFADFLSVLEYPEEEWKLRIMQLPVGFLPPIKLDEGYVQIPPNSFFVGTANKDDSTFSIADKVYDRSIPIQFDNRNEFFEAEGNCEPIILGMGRLKALFAAAQSDAANQFTREDAVRFSKVTDFIYEEFDVAFGNRVLNQIQSLVPVYIACGGTKEEVLDFILARKVLVRLEGRFEDYVKDGLKQVKALLANVYGAGIFTRSEKMLDTLIKKL